MRRQRLVRAAVAAAAALALAACTWFQSRPTPHPPPSPSARSEVESSIRAGAVLTEPVIWNAVVFPVDDVVVGHVDFLVDGSVRSSERTEPYQFEDGRPFAAWPLGDGPHTLGLRAVSTTGHVVATTTVRVRVRGPAHAGPPVGTYRRTLTEADRQRVASYRDAQHGAFGELPPTGPWSLEVRPDGVLVVDQVPPPPQTDPFFLPFRSTGTGRIRLEHAAAWLQPHPEMASSMCDPEAPSDYRWTAAGDRLTIVPVEHVCADRDSTLAGTWRRS